MPGRANKQKQIMSPIVGILLRGIVRILLFFVGNLQVRGLENIPVDEPYILVVNHMSKADPALILISIPGIQMRFFAGEKWEKHMLFGPLLRMGGAIFINRGQVDRNALKEARIAINEGSVFGLAPEGTRSRVGALIKARDGAAYLSTRSKPLLLPIGIVNTDRLGYNMAHLRRTKMEVVIGETFILPDIGRRPRGDELVAYTHLIMIHIAALLPKRYWGYYVDSPALKALLAGEDPWPHCLSAEGVTL